MYHLGFGFPLTLFLQLFPFFTGLGLYACLFPIWVALAQQSDPYTRGKTDPRIPEKFGIFSESDFIAGYLTKFVFALVGFDVVQSFVKNWVPYGATLVDFLSVRRP